MIMNKNDVVEKLAGRGYTKKAAKVALNDVIDVITEMIVEGEQVKLTGFGTFMVKDTKDKGSIDLQTRERIVIPGHRVPRFFPSVVLRRAVREGFTRE